MPAPLACLVDANNYIFRAFYGLPPMHAPDGTPTHATFGFARTLLKVIRDRRPDHLAAVFESGPSFRAEIYEEYKANRLEPPDDLVPQFGPCRRIAAAIGAACLELEGFEADDLMGTAARQLGDRGFRVLLVSGDKDLAQLVSDQVTLLDVAKGRELDPGGVEDVFGVPPARIPDLLALTGDAIDNIPGVAGVGPKTARALLATAGSLTTLLDDPASIGAMKIRGSRGIATRIAEARDQIECSLRLASIRVDAPMRIDPEEIRYHGAQRDELDRLFESCGFGPRLRDEIPRWAGTAVGETGRLDL